MNNLFLALHRAGYAVLDTTGKDPAAVKALLLYCDETEAAEGNNVRAEAMRRTVGKPAEEPEDAVLPAALLGYAVVCIPRTRLRLLRPVQNTPESVSRVAADNGGDPETEDWSVVSLSHLLTAGRSYE